MFVVFDLDGTLANCEARVQKYLLCPERGYPHKRRNVDWDGFFLECDTDEPIPHALEVLKALYNDGHTVAIWTGRSAIAREKTEQWLILHGVPQDVIDNMVMRPADYRADDHELKRDWLEHHGTPDLIFEDRNRVVDMWRSRGIPCYHVASGDF